MSTLISPECFTGKKKKKKKKENKIRSRVNPMLQSERVSLFPLHLSLIHPTQAPICFLGRFKLKLNWFASTKEGERFSFFFFIDVDWKEVLYFKPLELDWVWDTRVFERWKETQRNYEMQLCRYYICRTHKNKDEKKQDPDCIVSFDQIHNFFNADLGLL